MRGPCAARPACTTCCRAARAPDHLPDRSWQAAREDALQEDAPPSPAPQLRHRRANARCHANRPSRGACRCCPDGAAPAGAASAPGCALPEPAACARARHRRCRRCVMRGGAGARAGGRQRTGTTLRRRRRQPPGARRPSLPQAPSLPACLPARAGPNSPRFLAPSLPAPLQQAQPPRSRPPPSRSATMRWPTCARCGRRAAARTCCCAWASSREAAPA